ncbi:related to osmosensing protein SGD1 [Phialocephala subalpina]|uniref:Related to osmosensing protein SGD1 n=1 Tax=Phialocephala subalpina TaxID=576137 RepID=A0A1L7WXC9_9HELO|nr:related to osmosensing protein SGD1 [Phialocephala subalpina]
MAPPNQLKLPKVLLNEIGAQDAYSGGRKSRSGPGTRKELRKVARQEKKAVRSGPPPVKRTKLHHTEVRNTRDERPVLEPASKNPVQDESHAPQPKSILKTTKKKYPKPKAERYVRSISPSAKIPRAVKNKLAEDDEEIAALEKKLGMRGKKKLPQSFKDDGLDDLLEGLDEEDSDIQESRKRKAEGDEWLDQKRKQARKTAKAASKKAAEKDESDIDEEELEKSSDDDGASDMSLDGVEFPDDESEPSDKSELSDEGIELDADNDFEGFDSDGYDDMDEDTPAPRVRENPYVAPVATASAGKYVPPSLRKPASSDSDELDRLRRRTQGLVNRLTEANLISILGDIEKLYRENPRQHVTSTLVDILLTSVCEPTSLPDTLIILPAGFITAVYKVIGTDFGAQVIQRIVELFDEHYARASVSASAETSKETSNLIMLLSEMYNFQVVGSNLMFDYIKLFLGKLSELNAELLLKIIRTSGPQLRQDDPSSLKDIVAMLRPAVESVGENNISVRTKFMIETINNLKNNRMKTGTVASAVTSEHTIQMKKILGSLNTRNIKASEPLRIGLKDIQESDKKGKWWLVGASWAGNTPAPEEGNDNDHGDSKRRSTQSAEDAGTSDLLQLAREQRMNTDIRRAIFISIMSAEDYQDAYMRLMKLKLKKVQEYEIPKVLVHCTGGEKSYNPYYTLIAKKVCGDKRLRTSFQFCLWDLFKKMGESDEEQDVPDDEEDALETRQIVNLAKMFGTLVLEGGLGLTVFKNLNLSYLQPKTKTFMEVLFINILLDSQKQAKSKRDEQAVVSIFAKAKDTPELIRGLQYFLKKVVGKTDIAGGKDEKATVKWACKVAGDALEALASIDSVTD